MVVNGFVYDSAGNKIANADVTVTMVNGTTAGVSHATTSSSSPKGFFSVVFAVGEWATGEHIRVVAQYQGGLQAVNQSIDANGINFVTTEDVHIAYEIPQFGSMVGFLVAAGLIGVVACVALVWRRSAK